MEITNHKQVIDMQPNFDTDQNIQPAPPSQNRNFKKIGIIVLLIVLIVALLGLSYFYYIQSQKTAELSRQLDSVKAKQLTGNAQEPSTALPSDSTGNTEYTAAVGKFAVSLPETYSIIREIDGPGEGGFATVLEVAKKSKAGQNVIDSGLYDKFKIHSFPASSFGSFDEWIKDSHANRSVAKQSPQTIAGVQASVYDLEGLWYERRLYFQKNDLFYYMSYVKDSDVSMQTAKDVIAGFKFTN